MNKRKKWKLSVALLLFSLLLTGCKAAETEGAFFHDYLVEPFIIIIKTFGQMLGNSYGLAIIFITIILRTLLLPFALNAAKKQKIMREKMEIMRPELEKIQERMKAAKTKEEQMKIQQEMMQLYQKHDFNPFNMGCLPILLQIPIWMGLYYAIRLSPEIGKHSFLWFNLNETDIILAILAAGAYFLQFRVSMAMMQPATAGFQTEAQAQQQQQMMKMMGIMSPALIFVASLSTASALALYWTVSGIFLIGQTYLTRKLYPPHVPEKEDTQTKANNKGQVKKKKRKKKKRKK